MSEKKKPTVKKAAKKVVKSSRKGKKLGSRKPKKFPYVLYLTKELIAAIKKTAKSKNMFYTDFGESVLSKAVHRN